MSVNLKIPGADYRAEQNPDGTWNVFGVRGYATHVRKFPIGVDKENELIIKEVEVKRDFLEEIIKWHALRLSASSKSLVTLYTLSSVGLEPLVTHSVLPAGRARIPL